MCGIAGLVGAFVPGLGLRMNAAQAHRGPDGSGVFEDAHAEVMLAHVRLAILDLTPAAAQPMRSSDGRFVLSYNGEIYNFKELRHDLETQGVVFKSSGDTEVLLQGLARNGERFIERLNGIFAFACWDCRERELLLVRDPLGVKPLYYTEPTPGALLFASEIKSLLVHSGVRREPNFHALKEHLARCHGTGPHTALKNIQRLPAGCVLRWRAATRSCQFRSYWIARAQNDLRSYGEATQSLRTAIHTAAIRQMVSDVPVGAFLSGGLDSSLITTCASAGKNQDFRCYTITYPPSENIIDQFVDDSSYARELAESLGLPHIQIEIKPDVARLLPKLLWHMDEPIVDPAVIACFLVSQLARNNGTTVLLSGQGADELLGGYPRYQAVSLMGWLDGAPMPLRRLLAALSQVLPGTSEARWGGRMRQIRKVLAAASQSPEERFLTYCSATGEAEIDRVLSPAILADINGRRSTDGSFALLTSLASSGRNRFLLRDLFDYLPNHNLLYMDKMSMAVGVEARVPLLDLELVNQAMSFPFEWKVSVTRTKRILRDAAKGLVSRKIIEREKAGFGAPYRKWMRYDLAEMWNDLIAGSTFRQRGWFNPEALQEARRRSQEGRDDLYMLQWAVLTVELWAREFLDRAPRAESTQCDAHVQKNTCNRSVGTRWGFR